MLKTDLAKLLVFLASPDDLIDIYISKQKTCICLHNIMGLLYSASVAMGWRSRIVRECDLATPVHKPVSPRIRLRYMLDI